MEPGDTLFGQWQLMSNLGGDGYGAIFEARELKLDEMQEVRVLREEMVAGQPALLESVRQEVKLMRRLAHPHIGRVYDYREDLAQNLVLISMERIVGGNARNAHKLLEVASQHQLSIPLPLVLRILVQMMEALAEAHRQGINHEDIRPDCILLTGGAPEELLANPTADPGVKMVDFGRLSAFLENREEVMRSEVLKVAAYMAPELVKSGVEASSAADVYGAGAVVYELLTGKLPLGRFKLPSELRPGLPQNLDRLILSLMEHDPADRASAVSALPACRRLSAQAEMGVDAATAGGKAPPQVEVGDLVTFGEEDGAREPSRYSQVPVPRAKSPQYGWIGVLAVVMPLALGAVVYWQYFKVPEPVDEAVAVEDKEPLPPSLEDPLRLPVADPEPLKESGGDSEPELATLKIDLSPSDGKLYLGDAVLGAPPQIVDLPPGKYYVEGRKGGCEDKIVRVEAGQQDEIAIELDCPAVALEPQALEAETPAEPAVGPVTAALRSGSQGRETPRGMKFRFIEGGSVWLTVSRNRGIEDQDSKDVGPFWIGETEVTQAQWRAVMRDSPSTFAGCDGCPVENVSWLEVLRFTNKLSLDSGRYGCYTIQGCTGGDNDEICDSVKTTVSCSGYRLPTEAEWDLVARAGVEGPLVASGNGWCTVPGTRPVGAEANHRWGVRDLSGNVSEWVWSPADGRDRRARGGSYRSDIDACHPGTVSFAPQGARDSGRGFRIVRSHR